MVGQPLPSDVAERVGYTEDASLEPLPRTAGVTNRPNNGASWLVLLTSEENAMARGMEVVHALLAPSVPGSPVLVQTRTTTLDKVRRKEAAARRGREGMMGGHPSLHCGPQGMHVTAKKDYSDREGLLALSTNGPGRGEPRVVLLTVVCLGGGVLAGGGGGRPRWRRCGARTTRRPPLPSQASRSSDWKWRAATGRRRR